MTDLPGAVASLPIETLVGRESTGRLPERLAVLYDGNLDFAELADRPYVVGNFVETMDGIISFETPGKATGAVVSGNKSADAFVMGLLRSCADAVLIGSETLRIDTGAVLSPDTSYPSERETFDTFRRAQGKRRNPLNVVVTGSGSIDLEGPIFHTPDLSALIVTTDEGRERLHRKYGTDLSAIAIRSVGSGARVPPREILRVLFVEFGVRLLLHEGGARLFGAFLAESLVDELFLTIAPQIAGRSLQQTRPGFAGDTLFAPETAPWWRIRSVKRAEDHLFLRYRRDGTL